MTASVFIDGGAGTTGLEIVERLGGRDDLTLLTLDEANRKDRQARADALAAADFVILCLPDDAARESVALIGEGGARVIDASTAHRTAPGWTYGFAELSAGQRRAIAGSARVSNPGCYPTGFLALVAPLVAAGLIPADWPFTVNAVSGYSGGGKSMIAAFEDVAAPDATDTAFRLYALGLGHKHVGEMQAHAGLAHPPLFAPAVARTYRGMLVEVPLMLSAMPATPTPDMLRDALAAHFDGAPLVRVASKQATADTALLMLERLAGTDRIDLFVFGDAGGGQARLVAALDNLGKGAAGAAVQNLNLMAGLDETAGLRL
jgi:N-acetyl-gamma-glutamyl-phosphate reductase